MEVHYNRPSCCPLKCPHGLLTASYIRFLGPTCARQTTGSTILPFLHSSRMCSTDRDTQTCDMCSNCMHLYTACRWCDLLKCKTDKLTTRWIANVCTVNNGTRSTVRRLHREMGSIACNYRPLALCRMPNLAQIGLGTCCRFCSSSAMLTVSSFNCILPILIKRIWRRLRRRWTGRSIHKTMKDNQTVSYTWRVICTLHDCKLVSVCVCVC